MVNIRPLETRDLDEAQRIVRTAFGTFFGVPDLATFWTDRDYAHGRHGAEHTVSFAVDGPDGKLAGSNFATRWGSVGFFGPLSIRPELWNQRLAQPLVGAVRDAFDSWGTTHDGLCTFCQSTKHVWLYQKFGFYPRFLTALMMAPAKPNQLPENARYSALGAGDRKAAEDASFDLTNSLYDGLDLRAEIRTCAARRLGDALLIWEGSRLAAFAVCHWGPASEAGADCLFIKFAAARPGPKAGERFAALLDAADALAIASGMTAVFAGVNLAREGAYRQMMARGFRSEAQIVTLHRPNEPGYSRPGVYIIDDWR